MEPAKSASNNEVLLKNAEYSWAVGHVTDIGYSGGLTAFALMVSKAEDKQRTSMPIPTAMSALEILISFHPRIRLDWQDVACYYGAALFAYGLNRICTANSRNHESAARSR